MLKSFLDTMKACIPGKDKPNKKSNEECKLDDLDKLNLNSKNENLQYFNNSYNSENNENIFLKIKGNNKYYDEKESEYTPHGTIDSSNNHVSTTEKTFKKEFFFRMYKNTFGLGDEDEVEEINSSLSSNYKFKLNCDESEDACENNDKIKREKVVTNLISNFNQAQVNCQDIEDSDRVYSENSARNLNFRKESLANIKKTKATLLFTAKDHNLEEEMPEKVFSMNNIIILDSEINQARKITVEDEEGDMLMKKFLLIDASGLMDSIRKRRDGYVFFGPVAEYVKNYFKIYFLEKLYNQRFRNKF